MLRHTVSGRSFSTVSAHAGEFWYSFRASGVDGVIRQPSGDWLAFSPWGGSWHVTCDMRFGNETLGTFRLSLSCSFWLVLLRAENIYSPKQLVARVICEPEVERRP